MIANGFDFTIFSIYPKLPLAGHLLLAGRFPVGKVPTDKKVLRELHKILQADFPEIKIQTHSWRLPWLKQILDSLTGILRYPLYIAIGVAVLFGLFFLIRALIPYFHSKSTRNPSAIPVSNSAKTMPTDYFSQLFQQALAESQAGRYREALISLHKATVEYLITKVIISSPHKKYTNNDLKRKLSGDPHLYQPFSTIARYAEIAGFSSSEINSTDFNHALEVFKATFL